MSKGLILTFYIVLVLALFFGAFVCVLNFLYPQKHIDLIRKYADKYNLPPELVASVVNVESNFKEDAKSNKGAVGLMQLMPQTANWLNGKELSEEELKNPETNLNLGCLYLSSLLQEFENIDCALAGYNAGPGNVTKWLKSDEYSKDNKTLEKIPFKETENYVKKIKSNVRIYKFLLK